MIYLDSPAGVGFSYSKNQTDYMSGDLKTASDTHTFLLKVKMENDVEVSVLIALLSFPLSKNTNAYAN